MGTYRRHPIPVCSFTGLLCLSQAVAICTPGPFRALLDCVFPIAPVPAAQLHWAHFYLQHPHIPQVMASSVVARTQLCPARPILGFNYGNYIWGPWESHCASVWENRHVRCLDPSNTDDLRAWEFLCAQQGSTISYLLSALRPAMELPQTVAPSSSAVCELRHLHQLLKTQEPGKER